MTIEAINKWLDEEYGCSYTRLEELHNFYFENYCDLKQENQQLKIQVSAREEEYKKLEDKLSKIETLIINHNCDTGDIYYKYNSRFLKSELKERILEILYEVSE